MNEFFQTLFQTVLLQIALVGGIFFILGGILTLLQTKIQNIYLQSLGWKGILWTGWIGTPIHELSHMFFAWLFHHKIHGFSLFRPDPETGQLGYINHSYSRFNIFQRLGNFFIGAAPLIAGPIVLLILLNYFIPEAKNIVTNYSNNNLTFALVITNVLNTYKQFFILGKSLGVEFFFFLYLSFCVSSHMAPSKIDLKGMLDGIIIIIILLFITNAALLFFGYQYLPDFFDFLKTFQVIITIFFYAVSVSLLHLVLATILLRPFRR